jgi:hypothetical protein
MDTAQIQHERAVGDKLIAALNQKQGKRYEFYRRGDQGNDEGPDLIYRDPNGNSEIGLEVTGCYYNSNDATFQWQNARNLPDAPKSYSGVDFSSNLVTNINNRIQDKCCTKNYGRNCLLCVYIRAGLTTFKKFKDLLPKIKVPLKHRFVGIYLVGYFGVNNSSEISHAILELTPDSN